MTETIGTMATCAVMTDSDRLDDDGGGTTAAVSPSSSPSAAPRPSPVFLPPSLLRGSVARPVGPSVRPLGPPPHRAHRRRTRKFAAVNGGGGKRRDVVSFRISVRGALRCAGLYFEPSFRQDRVTTAERQPRRGMTGEAGPAVWPAAPPRRLRRPAVAVAVADSRRARPGGRQPGPRESALPPPSSLPPSLAKFR